MRTLFALLAVAALVLVATPVSANAGADGPMCMGCDAIIRLCQKVLHFTCVEAAPAAGARCMGCDPIIALCEKLFHVECVE